MNILQSYRKGALLFVFAGLALLVTLWLGTGNLNAKASAIRQNNGGSSNSGTIGMAQGSTAGMMVPIQNTRLRKAMV